MVLLLLNLKKEMFRAQITQSKIANYLGMNASYLTKKIKCQYEFTRDEMYLIHDKFFPETDMYYLFEADN